MAPQLRDQDRYDILGEHGRGGLGRVSRAHDRELGRDIAIKELITRGHLSEVRFLREALITARLEHPGIVPVYEAGRWSDGTPFYAMKLVSGRPLRDLIAERKTVDERIRLLHHVIAVADAIAYAHGRNIIHRDLKPANVIVGEFGETVVIDWGLAKDVSTTEESVSASGSFRTSPNDGLTSAGTILGTPAYMAPEQARGEPVDQRADVFAIGAMLWELCSLHKLPPNFSGQRRRLLRQSGIDPDLATIVAKAVDPDPAHRYPDAGALAADLKAFKAGARIAARRYSPWALLMHWARRHRPLAVTMTTAFSVVLAGTALYVRNVARQRDRADASEEAARRSQRSAEASLDALTLKHAELLLTTDPSAALDALATYAGDEHEHAESIRAKATGMGVASLRAKPHTENVRWIAGTRDGAIISLSTDGTIVKTSPDGTSHIVARGVSSKGRAAYAEARGLLAFGCDPADVCIWDVQNSVRIPSAPAFHGWQLARIAFSSDETKLALLSYSGLVRVFDVSDPAQPIERLRVQRAGGEGLVFVDDDTIAIGISDHQNSLLELLRLDGTSSTLNTHDNYIWDTKPQAHRFALVTAHGEGIYLSSSPLHILHKVQLCRDTPTGLRFLANTHEIAYACREGTVGTWDTETRIVAPLFHMDGHVDTITTDGAGSYLVATGGNGILAVLDLTTRLISHYRGHEFRITYVALPTAAYPHIVSGDLHGVVRVWPLPRRVARVSAHVHTRFASAIFDKVANAFVATTFRAELTVSSASNPNLSISPHLSQTILLEAGEDAFAAYGAGEFVEMWDARSLSRKQLINTHQGAVSRVAFIGGSGDFLTAGRDGRMIRWTSTGTEIRAVSAGMPIVDFAVASDERSILAATSNGALWLWNQGVTLSPVYDAGVQTVQMINIPKSNMIAVAYANGALVVFDTRSWKRTSILGTPQTIRQITCTNDGSFIAVVDNDDIVHIAYTRSAEWSDGTPRWKTFSIHARIVAFASNGVLIALCGDGTVWFYSIEHDRWHCVFTGIADLNALSTSSPFESAAVFDSDGRIIWFNLQQILELLSVPLSFVDHHRSIQ